MSDIHDLEQRLQALEDAFAEQSGKIDRLLEKSDKALDLALHAYKVDHYGYIWQYDCETKEYVKSNMRVCTPEIADRALHSRHIADGAVEGRNLQDDCIGEQQIKDNSITGDKFVDDVFHNGKLANDAVSTRNIQNRAVTPEKLSTRVVPEVFDPLLKPLYAKDRNLQNQINLLFASGSEYGNAREFRKLWLKIAEMTGEDYSDSVYSLMLSVSPRYFIGEAGCVIDIAATTEGLDTVFEHIAFYIDNVLVVQQDNTDYMQHETEITKTSVVKCVATILGETYVEQRTVTHYSSFWLGAGNNYTDAMKKKNLVSLDKGWRLAQDVVVGDNQHIIIVLGEALREGFIRADINGLEIAFTETLVSIDGRGYAVLVSEDIYEAGTYNIDING